MSTDVANGVIYWTRAEAGLPGPVRPVGQATKTKFIVHHSGGAELGHSDLPAWVRGIYRHHTAVNGWNDIGYNFLVAADPANPDLAHVFEGRGWSGVGAHTVGHNTDGLAVCYLRTGPATEGVRRAIRWVYERAFPSGAPIYGHGDLNKTECPGDLLDWVHASMPVNGAPSKPVATPVVARPVVTGHPQLPAGTYLQRGSRGELVRTFQARMRERGWSIDVDGAFGPATEAIVRKFQSEKRLGTDGIVGQKTWNAAYELPVT